jgi:subtilisin family serine protease
MWRGSLAVALSAVLVATGASASSGAVAPPPATPGLIDPAQSGGQQVTLVTGDVVTIGDAGDGRKTVSVAPADGRENVTFQSTEVDEELLVIPSDTVPYLASSILDRRLFNVTALIEDGYAERDALPLIATYADPDAMRSQSIPEARTVRPLPSIDGTALEAGNDRLADLWRSLTPGETSIADTSGGVSLAGGLSRLWLDGRVRATLEQSVGQIGAPDAWSAGYTGEGVEVAVLDTGADATHPDLAERIIAQQDFSASPSGATDSHGHGTHVASTIAGTGAGSAGRERGVAYDADLLIGKVLNDDGVGYDSWIIAGMEWAAAEGADIVNMSLGGGPTDGTDPLSTAVDRISADTGTLFVVAAGNEGAAETVGTPGAAASALTVAAVDAQGALADFSSRGPRAGDGALKPDISAPGVDIVAARASGTAMGSPVDELYTSASGTSMATPHVAGAAALLAQQRPELTGADLKELLMSSASPSPDLSVWEQGSGEAELTRALVQQVRASGSVDFARVTDEAPAARTVTYRNDSDAPARLSLTLDAHEAGNPSLRTDAFAVPASVDVPAHGTAEVTVTLDPARLERGHWTGRLVAASDDGDTVVDTAVGAVREGPRHRVTVTALDFDGQDSGAPVITLFGDRTGTDWMQYLLPGDPPLGMDVEEGTYLLHAVLNHSDPQDERTVEIVDPTLEITGDMSIVLDPRESRQVRVRTPQPAQQQAVHSYYIHREFGTGRAIAHGVMSFGEPEIWVTPTEEVVDGTFEFSSRRQMVRPSALLEARGLRGIPEMNLLSTSPEWDRPRTLRLAAPGPDFAGVRGRIAVVPAPDPGVEEGLVAQAAAAGAAAIILVRPETFAIRTVFRPAWERDPIPGMLTTARDGERLLALARDRGATATLEVSRSSPYLYDIQHSVAGSIPDGVEIQVTKANTHRIRTTYSDTGGFPWTDEQRFSWRPWQEYAWNDASRLVATPSTREEWVTADDSLWQHRVASTHDEWNWGALSAGVTGPPRTYKPGRSEETWYGTVLRSAGVAGVPSTRTGDVMSLLLPEYVDAEGHYSIGETTSTAARLYRDDALIAEPGSGVADVEVTGGSARYRFELSVRRDDPEWRWSTAVETAWMFRSDRPKEGSTAELPLLHVSYEAPVDATGTASRHRHTLPIRVTDAAGDTVRDAKVDVWLSFDAGATWEPARTTGRKGDVQVTVPRGEAPVSVRVVASAGGKDRQIEQTVIDAYGRE